MGLVLVAAAAGLGVGVGAIIVRRGGGGQAGSPEARRQWARRLADASFDGLLVHRGGTILQMNRALVRMLGFREVELLGTQFANLAHPEQAARLRTELEAPQPQIVEFTLLNADKAERFVEMASHTLEIDGLPGTVTAIRNVTAQRALEARLAQLTHNDPLTGLANAATFSERLQEAVTRNDVSGGHTAVLTIELEQLKAVNERMGRAGGDNLMRQIAQRLNGMVDDSDTLARLGGIKFAIIQPLSVQPLGGAPNRTALLTSQIEAAMEEPFIVEGKAVRASLSIGVAIYPEHASSTEALVHASGFALSKAIEKGGTHMFSHAEATAAGFSAVMSRKNNPGSGRMLSLDEQRLAHDLRLAIPRGEISLEYQPIFTGRLLSLAGYEALARWRHPRDGVIQASKFIALGDDAGLAAPLGNFILETACLEAVRSGAPFMAVNISPLQFRDPQLPSCIRDILHKAGLPPERLEVQVVEAMVMENPAAASQSLKALSSIGVALTLDDFGIGFSSLSNLSDFPFTRVKIDKKFIRQLGEDSNTQAIVMAILSLARSLNIEVIAEGIENAAQLQFLQEKDCSFVQGFFLGPPAANAGKPQAGSEASGAQAAGQPAGQPVAAKPGLLMTQR